MTPGVSPWPPGARLDGRLARFCVWAPNARAVELVLTEPRALTVSMDCSDDYCTAFVDDVEEGQRYGFRLDGSSLLPDPASRNQPDGVHGPSAILASDFAWSDAGWRGPMLDEYVIYELHVGTFTDEGTFAAAATRLDELRDLGITVIELLPVAQFAGARNWGYDGVHPYAVQNSYGGPRELKRFIDRCHAAGLAVCLDVVYNHLGPEGNTLGRFGPYFTDRYHTPWGGALNFDGPGSDHVREYFIGNALQWIDEFHADALRLDAVHAILDQSARPFLRELSERVHDRGAACARNVVLIAESDLGDPRMIQAPDEGGLGMDAQWLDDFHHALHSVLTGEQSGYYGDFGRIEQLARAYCDGFVYTGQYSSYRQRRHGAPLIDIPPRRFVVFAQNHDQIGNRMHGDRLTSNVSFDQLKLTAAAVLLSPFTPLLFMGEEYAEQAPFPYFVSHTDSALVEAVRRGRAAEFASFAWAGEPPDPQAESTFGSARLDWRLRSEGEHAVLLALHRELLHARRELAPIRTAPDLEIAARADATAALLEISYTSTSGTAVLLLHFGTGPCRARTLSGGDWLIRIDTAASQWNGPGRIEPSRLGPGRELELGPHSAVLLTAAEHGQ